MLTRHSLEKLKRTTKYCSLMSKLFVNGINLQHMSLENHLLVAYTPTLMSFFLVHAKPA